MTPRRLSALALVLLALARVAGTALLLAMVHPDEFFQSQEVMAHHAIRDPGLRAQLWLPWEFVPSSPNRSVLFPCVSAYSLPLLSIMRSLTYRWFWLQQSARSGTAVRSDALARHRAHRRVTAARAASPALRRFVYHRYVAISIRLPLNFRFRIELMLADGANEEALFAYGRSDLSPGMPD